MKNKLKMTQRKIKLIYRDTTGYGIPTVIHYINSAGVTLTLEPIVYSECVKNQSTLDTRLHNYMCYKLRLKFKDVELTKTSEPWKLSHVLGNAVHEFNHAYLDKHLNNPEEYPLCEARN